MNAHMDIYRVVPYMQTERYPTRSAIESKCSISDAWHLTGIFDTEKAALREVARRESNVRGRSWMLQNAQKEAA